MTLVKSAPDPQFIYLDYGDSSDIGRELYYSISTLMAEIGDSRSRVSIFTDRQERFSGLGGQIVDVRPFFAEMTHGGAYRHRAKPAVLARALGMYERPCVLLDSDSFVREGFDATIRRALAAGAAMNGMVAPTLIRGLAHLRPICRTSDRTNMMPTVRSCSTPVSSRPAPSTPPCWTTPLS